MSAPRPFERDPFHPLSSINNRLQFLYIQEHSSYFLYVVRQVSCGGAYLTITHALLRNRSCFRPIISLVFFHMVQADA